MIGASLSEPSALTPSMILSCGIFTASCKWPALNSSAERTSIQTPFAFSGYTILCLACGVTSAWATKEVVMATAEIAAASNFFIIQSPIK